VRALGAVPGDPDSAGVIDVPEPPLSDGSVLVQGRRVGICGTDAEIVRDGYGSVPEGADRLVLGHESLGEVLEAPATSNLVPGDLVVGIVRRPDPEPCVCCQRQQWDMCRNGRYVERGIMGAPGYGSERWRADPGYVVKIDPALGDLGVLIEPTSVVAKAWEQIERIGARACFDPQVAVVTGAGPVGLLAAMLARQRGLETWVLEVVTDGPKPQLVADLSATYWANPPSELPVQPDVVVECTGIGPVLAPVVATAAPNSVIALAGVSQHSRPVTTDLDSVNRQLVLGNQVIFGTVNAARRHYDQAAEALARADPTWLDRLLTREVPISAWPDALGKGPEDIKVTVRLDGH
jgi:glucose 1-dehydrogenase